VKERDYAKGLAPCATHHHHHDVGMETKNNKKVKEQTWVQEKEGQY